MSKFYFGGDKSIVQDMVRMEMIRMTFAHDLDLPFTIIVKVPHVVHGQDNGVVSDFIECFDIVFARKVDNLKSENVEISRRHSADDIHASYF